ncbi:MAG: hypothetical protein IT384_23620 [Deltaproteobacteria bacterium]|nr:hypothetical protein [Deltaproteobacteria bacterium]
MSASLLLLIACGGTEAEVPDLPDPNAVPPARPAPSPTELPPPATLREHLERGVTLTLDPTSQGFELAVTPSGGEPRAVSAELDMSTEARVALDARGRLELGRVAIRVADLEISAESFPPYGLHITDIHASFGAEPIALEWAAGEQQATFQGAISLRVEWALIGRNGERLTLRPIETPALDVEGAIARGEDGRLTVDLGGRAGGTLLHVQELVDMSNLSFGLRLFGPML